MIARAQTLELIPAVGYVRMSTDSQKDSPERQRDEIIAMAARDGFRIIKWYEDHGLTGTESKNRPQFQQMMADVPKRQFKAILLYEQSRFSREDVFDAMAHWKIIQAAGVSIFSVQRGEMRFESLGDLITAIVGQHEARSESVRLAHRCISGKQRKVRTGAHVSAAPFGFEREILDETGAVVRRVKSGEQFRRPPTWKSRLVPSEDPQVVEAIRYMFEAMTQGQTPRQIAMELNKRGLTTSKGRPFQRSVMRKMLRNPVYMGSLYYGRQERGKFAKVEELIVVPNAHPAIVSQALFEEVQSILSATDQRHGGATQPGKFPLSGVLVCGACGKRMSGSTTNGVRRYRCDVTEVNCCRPLVTVSADAIEGLVLRLILQRVLNETNREKLAEAIDRLRIKKSDAPNPLDGQMEELQSSIARAENNLAKAEGDNFDAIAKRLDEWRTQLKKLRTTRINAQTPVGSLTADGLQLLRDNLMANPLMLAVAIKKTIRRVSVHRVPLPKLFETDFDVRSVQGVIEFHTEILADPIRYSDADLYPEKSLQSVVDYVRRAGRYVRADELSRALQIPKDVALSRAKRAVRLGLLAYRRRGNLYLFEAALETADSVSREDGIA